jgi:rubredoxin
MRRRKERGSTTCPSAQTCLCQHSCCVRNSESSCCVHDRGGNLIVVVWCAWLNCGSCRECDHIYDADEDSGGTPFDQLPESWKCPVCSLTIMQRIGADRIPGAASLSTIGGLLVGGNLFGSMVWGLLNLGLCISMAATFEHFPHASNNYLNSSAPLGDDLSPQYFDCRDRPAPAYVLTFLSCVLMLFSLSTDPVYGMECCISYAYDFDDDDESTKLVHQIPMFKHLTATHPDFGSKLAARLVKRVCDRGQVRLDDALSVCSVMTWRNDHTQVLIEQGTSGEEMYFLVRGSIHVSIGSATSDPVATITCQSKHVHFGEVRCKHNWRRPVQTYILYVSHCREMG